MTLAVAGTTQYGYNLNRSLRFRASASATLTRTPSVASNRRTWTWSGWVKRGAISTSGGLFEGTDAGKGTFIDWQANNITIQLYDPTYNTVWNTPAVLRDPSSWYHIVVSLDTTQASQSNMVKVYINGIQQSLTVTTYASTVPQNYQAYINNTVKHNFNTYVDGTYGYGDQYLAEINFVDGQALTPSSFGSTNPVTGVWQPAKYTGTYGTNGFYLPFTNTASTTTIGYDFSGNGNNWTANNISLTAGATYDSMYDVPTLTSPTVANYCTLNPLDSSTNLITNGNLTGTANSGAWYSTRATFGMSTGKWYWEVYVNNYATTMIGIGKSTATLTNHVGADANGYGYYVNGSLYYNNTSSAYGSSYTTGDTIGVSFDTSTGTLVFYKNNTSQGNAVTGLTGTWFPMVGLVTSGQVSYNFGQRPFTYTPPAGYVALNTYNLPDSTIVQGNKYMDATTYTATGTTQTITNTGGFQPDLVWTKNRGAVSANYLIDSNRGATYNVQSQSASAEASLPNYLTSFNSNGFTIGTDNYANGNTLVGWQWQAGQGTNTTNTNGSVTSTVSASTTAGFSIATFTCQSSGSATVGHGLGVAPGLMILKSRGTAAGWTVYHSALGNTSYMLLQTTNSVATGATTVWNSTSPTSSVFSIGSAFAGGGTYLAYCWAEIAGFSKFGSYTGNGLADGPFIYTGFRPKFILTKRTDSTGDWWIQDTSRAPYNAANALLYPNLSNAEYTTAGVELDILSNGFKPRNGNTSQNGNGASYIYACFAENPFKYALAR